MSNTDSVLSDQESRALPMTEIDIEDDDKLRYIQRVLESNAPEQDRDAAAQMVRDLRRRVRKVYAAYGRSAPIQEDEPK